MLVRALKCFSDVARQEVSRCEQRKGFRSCFIKYDQGKELLHLLATQSVMI